MERTVPAVSLDAVSSSVYGTQIAQRIQYVVTQVMNTNAGAPVAEVSRILTHRLRGMGVNPSTRAVQQLAEIIARLPKSG